MKAKIARNCYNGLALNDPKDDDRLVGAWRDLLDRHARTTSALERSLHEHGLGVSEYEVLERLATGEND